MLMLVACEVDWWQKMPSSKQFSRIDTAELKCQLVKKLGRLRAEKYFFNLKRLISRKVSKFEFDKLCCLIVGKENLALHNLIIRSIVHNACLAVGPPGLAVTGNSWTMNVCSNGKPFTPSQQRAASVNSKNLQCGERPSSLGTCGYAHRGQDVNNSSDLQRSGEQQSLPDLVSIGSKPLLGFATVEDGEEVEQVTINTSDRTRSPVKAPLGIPLVTGGCPRKFSQSCHGARIQLGSGLPETCCRTSELPDSVSLKRRLEKRLEVEGLNVSLDCANLLSHGLDAFLRRLIKPSMSLAGTRCRGAHQFHRNVSPSSYAMQISSHSYHASLLDFQVALESNPTVLGSDWSTQLEKIDFYLYED